MAAALFLVATACNHDNGAIESRPHATVQPAPPTTADPYAIPDVIDTAYVNRVLAGLDAAVGDIVRLIVRTHDIPPEVNERLKAIYVHPKDVELFVEGMRRDMEHNFAGYKPTPGNAHTTVAELLSVSRSCVFARVARDYSEVSTAPAV